MKSLNLFKIIFLLILFPETAAGLEFKFNRDKFLSGKAVVGLIKDKNSEITVIKGDFRGAEIDFFPAEGGKYYCIKGINIYTKSGEYPFLINVQYKNGEKETVEYKVLVEGQKIGKEDEIKIARENIKDVTKENSESENIYIKDIVGQITNECFWWKDFIMPAKGAITSPFDGLRSINNGVRFFHLGLDIGCPEGTEVKASNCGVVVLTEKLISRGNTVIIDHGQGIFSVYYHLSRIEVEEKDFLKKGDLIGFSGMTGISTGPHLHWSIFANGVAVDPADWIDGSIEKFILEN